MARIRSIKPEFWTSEQIVDMSTTARLLFIGMWTFADDAGRLPASTRRLKMQVFPADEVDQPSIQRLVDELRRVGLVVEYEVEGQRFWQVTGWDRHQRVDKPTVKYLGPSDGIIIPFDEASTSPHPRSGVEWSGEESKKDTHTTEIETARVKRADPAALVEMPIGGQILAGNLGSCLSIPSNSDFLGKTQPMPPTAPPPGVKPPLRSAGKPPLPKNDDELRPFFAAFCRGANLPLTWNARYILPTEQIAASGLTPERLRAVAAHYRAKLKDATPSFSAFAQQVDRWQADLRSTEGPAARVVEADPDKCPKHPSVDVSASPCELCAIVDTVSSQSQDWNPKTTIRGGAQ